MENIQIIQNIIFENSQKFSENEYLNLMNNLHTLSKKIDPVNIRMNNYIDDYILTEYLYDENQYNYDENQFREILNNINQLYTPNDTILRINGIDHIELSEDVCKYLNYLYNTRDIVSYNDNIDCYLTHGNIKWFLNLINYFTDYNKIMIVICLFSYIFKHLGLYQHNSFRRLKPILLLKLIEFSNNQHIAIIGETELINKWKFIFEHL